MILFGHMPACEQLCDSDVLWTYASITPGLSQKCRVCHGFVPSSTQHHYAPGAFHTWSGVPLFTLTEVFLVWLSRALSHGGHDGHVCHALSSPRPPGRDALLAPLLSIVIIITWMLLYRVCVCVFALFSRFLTALRLLTARKRPELHLGQAGGQEDPASAEGNCLSEKVLVA